jgi:tetratricopeptide (TPR) repeat protein
VRSGDLSLERAAQLLASNQPAQALELLEPAVKRHRNDPNVLLLTGLAAYRSDQLRAALDYWKQSLDLSPNDMLTRVYERVRREAEADRSGEKLLGMHIALRYEGEALPTDTARAILSTLDEDYSRIASQLGCTSDERIVAIVQSRDSYLRGTGAAEWSGGEYDGRIHIAWTEGKEVGPQMRRALAHELVHACLTGIPSGTTPWPAWLQEGLAQKLSGDQLSSASRDQLRQFAAARQIPRLEDLHQDWSHLSIDNARLAYNLALAAADALYDTYSSSGIRNVINNPQSLSQITTELDRKLGL